MTTYIIMARKNHGTVRTWEETNKRSAIAEARKIAKDYGDTIDEVGVYNADMTVYRMRRTDEDGWYQTEIES